MSAEMIGTRSEQKSDEGVSRKRQIGFYVSGGLFLLVCVAVFGRAAGGGYACDAHAGVWRGANLGRAGHRLGCGLCCHC